MKRNYKKLAVIIAVMILTLSLASTGFAANTLANLKAYYRNITVYKNGVQVKFTNEPFIVDGTTYVPLRDMSEVLDKNVTWDGTTYKIGINDKPGQNINELYQQVLILQMQVTQLQNENKTLKDQLGKSSLSLGALEDNLNDDYSKIGGVTINNIVLKGDKSKIEVQIHIDTNTTKQYDAWNKLIDTNKKNFFQKIVDDILAQFKDADVTGFIQDKYDSSKPVRFTITSRGVVVLGSGTSGSNSNINDLEDYLNDQYSRTRGVDFKIYLTQNKSSIKVEIQAYSDDITNEFTKTQLENYINGIYKDIIAYFPSSTVSGFIEDDLGKLDFDITSKGAINLKY